MTVCDAAFFRRGMQISCAIHIFFIAFVGMTIFAAQKEESVKEEYIFVTVEEQQSTVAVSVPEALPQAQAMQMFQPQSSQPRPSAAHSLPGYQAAAEPSAQTLTGDSGFTASTEEVSEYKGAALSADSTGVYAQGDVAETASSYIDVAEIAARFAGVVESRKEYPYMALKRGETGRVAVFVRLDADGFLAVAEIVESSGVKSLDTGAIKAVQNSCPYVHKAGQAVEFVVPIVYELRGR